MLFIVSGTGWLFLNVAVFGELAKFTAWLPKASAAGVSVVWATPVPVRLTDASRLLDSSLMFSAPEILPTNVGAKYTLILQEPPPAILPDRKSTRLNSSHLGISYAVFCLK